MIFLFLESLGTTELLVILVVALVLFGPRKLPELSRSLGKSLNEFKRAGDDFKRTWEREVEIEKLERELKIEDDVLRNPAVAAESPAQVGGSSATADWPATGGVEGQSIARTTTTSSPPYAKSEETSYGSAKQDWV